MGAITSRQNAGVEEADVVSNHAYKYPPRSGNYFGSHFIMGGERFDTPQPEAYLFGENADLNFLGSRPTPFPYPPPQSNEPTKTLKSLVNIRKESLRFVRCPEPIGKVSDAKMGDGELKHLDSGKGTYYNIEFTFDCDAKIAITIYYFCTEEVTPAGVVYYPRDPAMTSQTYHYKKGANQQFCQLSHVMDPSRHPEEELLYSADREIIPIAIYCAVSEGQEAEIRQSHTTIAVVEKHSDGTYVLKALKQKLFVDGLCYLLQEIYGIENKNLDTKPTSDEETEDGGSECVICMCDVRDTLILPCRHLCLCNSCADSLRYQANNCPICRAPFRALLQIRALQRLAGAAPPPALHPANTPTDGSMENIPAGYEPVSLIEALNGVSVTRAPPPPAASIASPDTDTASQAAEALNRCAVERSSSTSLGSGGSRKGRREQDKRPYHTPEFRMSVLLARSEDKRPQQAVASSPLLYQGPAKPLGDRAKSKSKSSLNSAPKYPLPTEEGSGSEGEGGSAGEGDGEGDALPGGDGAPDSDAERLSPLLTHHAHNGVARGSGARGSTSSLTAADPARLQAKASRGSTGSLTKVNPTKVTLTKGGGRGSNGSLTKPGRGSATSLAHDGPRITTPTPTLAHIDDTDLDEPTAACSEAVDPPDGAQSYETLAEPSAILSALRYDQSRESPNATMENPQRWPLPHHVTSLPGTPISQSSVRSSGDSYSSTSSSRQLLGGSVPRAARPAC